MNAMIWTQLAPKTLLMEIMISGPSEQNVGANSVQLTHTEDRRNMLGCCAPCDKPSPAAVTLSM